jgi:hypothetical protein
MASSSINASGAVVEAHEVDARLEGGGVERGHRAVGGVREARRRRSRGGDEPAVLLLHPEVPGLGRFTMAWLYAPSK